MSGLLYAKVGIDEARAIYAARMSGIDLEPPTVIHGPSHLLIGDNVRDGVIICDDGRPVAMLQSSLATTEEKAALKTRYDQAVADYQLRSRIVH